MTGPIMPAAVQYADVEVGDGRVVKCVSAGLYLARREGAPIVLVLARGQAPFGGNTLKLEGISPDADAVSATLRDLCAAMREHNVYRGRTISLHASDDGRVIVRFHTLAPVERDAVILPTARSSGSSATRSASPSTRSACALQAATSSAACCCTARPG